MHGAEQTVVHDALVDLEASAFVGMAEPKPKQVPSDRSLPATLSCEGPSIGGQAHNETVVLGGLGLGFFLNHFPWEPEPVSIEMG